jgi:hypothetical protein
MSLISMILVIIVTYMYLEIVIVVFLLSFHSIQQQTRKIKKEMPKMVSRLFAHRRVRTHKFAHA